MKQSEASLSKNPGWSGETFAVEVTKESYFWASFTLVTFIIEREDGIISLSVYFRLSWRSL